MGNNLKGLNFEYKVSRKDFELVKKFRDPRYGEVSEMKNKQTGKIVLMKEKEIKTIQRYKELVDNFTQRISLSHRNLMPIYGFTGMDRSDIFAYHNKVCVYFEYLQNDLLQAIKSRKNPFSASSELEYINIQSRPQPFEESELFGIITQLIEVLEYLQQNGISHGDIRPETCFISNEGVVKILDQWCISDIGSDQEIISTKDRRMFVTPRTLSNWGKIQFDPVENIYKQDVFSLGMTVLECITLESSSDLYNWDEFNINIDLLSQRLLKARQNYSPQLNQALTLMLELDETKRPDFIQLKHLVLDDGKSKTTHRQSLHTSMVEEGDLETDNICHMNPKLMTALGKTSPKRKPKTFQFSTATPTDIKRNFKSIQKTPTNLLSNLSKKSPSARFNHSSSSKSATKKAVVKNLISPKNIFEDSHKTNFLATPNQNRRSAIDLDKVNHIAKSSISSNTDFLKKSIDTQFFRTSSTTPLSKKIIPQPTSTTAKKSHYRSASTIHKDPSSRTLTQNHSSQKSILFKHHHHHHHHSKTPSTEIHSHRASSSNLYSTVQQTPQPIKRTLDLYNSNNHSKETEAIMSSSLTPNTQKILKTSSVSKSRLETSKSAQNLNENLYFKKNNREKSKLFENILHKVQNSASINVPPLPTNKTPSKAAYIPRISSIKLMDSIEISNSSTARPLSTDKKETSRSNNMSHRSSHSIVCPPGLKIDLTKQNADQECFTSPKGYSSTFYNNDSNLMDYTNKINSLNNIMKHNNNKPTTDSKEQTIRQFDKTILAGEELTIHFRKESHEAITEAKQALVSLKKTPSKSASSSKLHQRSQSILSGENKFPLKTPSSLRPKTNSIHMKERERSNHTHLLPTSKTKIGF